MSDFLTASKTIVTDFLQNVVIIDDEAIYPGPNSHAVTMSEVNTPVGRGTKANLTPSGTVATIPQDNSGHMVNMKTISDSFASHGLLCSIFRPEEHEEDFVEKTTKVLKKADIVILDWNIKIKDKDPEATIKELIQAIVQDNEKHKQKGMRYIAIYSGEEKLSQKLEVIKTILDTLIDASGIIENNYTLRYDHLQINIYAKKSQSSQTDPDIEVTENELVEKIIDDFTQLIHGIVPNMALQSLTEIRKNTHRLISKFAGILDDAYLTHRAMLPEPKDAEELLITMVTDELQSILEDCNLTFDEEKFNLWFNERIDVLTPNQLDTKLKCCYFNKENYESLKEFLSIKPFCTDGEYDFTEIYNDSEIKFNDSKLNPLITKNRERLKETLKDDVQNYILHGVDNNPTKPSFKAVKGQPLIFTSILINDGKTSNDELALLSTNKTFYNSPVPYITLGTILKDNNGKYFISLMPRCDAARVKSPGNTFPLLPLSKNNKNFEVIFKDTVVRRYKIDFAPKKLRTIHFRQEEAAINSPIYAKKENGTYTFTDDSDMKFMWVAELKKEKAQNISNKFAAQLSRVGFNESEYLRRAYQ